MQSLLHVSWFKGLYWAMLTLMCMVGVSACMTVPAPHTVPAYILTGRFAVTYLEDGVSKRDQGAFEWRLGQHPSTLKSDTAMTLYLKSPLGNTVAQLEYDPTIASQYKAVLRTSQSNIQALDLDALMNQVLGWSVPLHVVLPAMFKSQDQRVLIDSKQAEPSDTQILHVGWNVAVISRYDSHQVRVATVSNEQRHIQVRWVFDEAAQ